MKAIEKCSSCRQTVGIEKKLIAELQAKDQEIAGLKRACEILEGSKMVEIDRHFKECQAKDQTISSLMDAQDNWVAERADLLAKLQGSCEGCKYEDILEGGLNYPCSECQRYRPDYYILKDNQ